MDCSGVPVDHSADCGCCAEESGESLTKSNTSTMPHLEASH
jgi:hypothetical protein